MKIAELREEAEQELQNMKERHMEEKRIAEAVKIGGNVR